MTGSGFWRTARLVGVVAVLLLTVWGGFKDGSENLRSAETLGQRVAVTAQLLYGVAALASLWALLRRTSWLRIALIVWILGTSITAGFAPVVWGGAGLGSGAAAGASTVAAAALVAWGALAHHRAPKRLTAQLRGD